MEKYDLRKTMLVCSAITLCGASVRLLSAHNTGNILSSSGLIWVVLGQSLNGFVGPFVASGRVIYNTFPILSAFFKYLIYK